MHTQLHEVQRRIEGDLSVGRFINLLEAAAEEMGWAEDTLFDLTLEYNDLRREDYEMRRAEWNGLLTDEKWNGLHQCVLMNQWIKGMNLKVAYVRRVHHALLTLKCESIRTDMLHTLTELLDRVLMRSEKNENGVTARETEEREQLFGSMLLTEKVADQVRTPFLTGNFSEALRLGYAVYARRLEMLLGMPLKPWKEMETIFFQDPPCFLFPDLSGARLKVELAALARLSSGLELLLQPLLRGLEKASDDPAVILKLLVFISLLVDRLDAAVPNPSAVHKKRTSAKRTPTSRPKRTPTRRRVPKGKPLKKRVKKINKKPAARLA